MALHPQNDHPTSVVHFLECWSGCHCRVLRNTIMHLFVLVLCVREQTTYSALVSYYLLPHKVQAVMNHITGS